MMKLRKFSRTSLAVMVLLVFVAPAASARTLPASAANLASASRSDACAGLSTFGDQGCTTNSCQGSQIPAKDGCTDSAAQGRLNGVVGKITDVLSYIIGGLAVIMIVVSGIRFMTAGGDSAKVESAKSGIMYALIGIVIVALAQIIVRYVVNRAAGGAG